MATLRAILVLRLWRDSDSAPDSWRGEIEHIQSGTRRRFADQAALLANLLQALADAQAEHQSAASDADNPGPD